MGAADLIEISRDGLITFFKVGMPVMLVGLAVGFIISLFQALTQIQEQTLIYVPKVAAIFGSLLFFLPFMSDAMNSFMGRIAARIIAGGQ